MNDKEARYDMPPEARPWIVFISLAWGAFLIAMMGYLRWFDIGWLFGLWFGGSVGLGWLIVRDFGGMQKRDDRRVFGAAQFADDREHAKAAGLCSVDD